MQKDFDYNIAPTRSFRHDQSTSLLHNQTFLLQPISWSRVWPNENFSKRPKTFKNWPKPFPPVLIFPMKSCFCIKKGMMLIHRDRKGYAILISFYAWCALYLPRLWLAHSGNGFDRQIDALLYNVTMNDWERQHSLPWKGWLKVKWFFKSLTRFGFFLYIFVFSSNSSRIRTHNFRISFYYYYTTTARAQSIDFETLDHNYTESSILKKCIFCTTFIIEYFYEIGNTCLVRLGQDRLS